MTDQFIKLDQQPLRTRLIFVIDRSGSMNSIKDETISSFNAFIEEQRKQPGEATLTLVQFDNQYEVHYTDVPLAEAPALTAATFVPRGYTALYDAVGRTIAEALAGDADDVKTIVAVLTDGQENASSEYNYATVNEQVKKAQDELGWEVLFVGANMNAAAVGAAMGIKGANIATYDATAVGATAAINTLSASTTSYRSVAKFAAANVDMQALYDGNTKA